MLLVFIVILLFVYMDKIILFGYLYNEKHKYNKEDYAYMYVVPESKNLNISGLQCFDEGKHSWDELKFKSLNLLVPVYIDKNIKSDSLTVRYDDGKALSAFISSIDVNIFKPNADVANDLKITNSFSDFTNFDVLEYILDSTPDDLLDVNDPKLLTTKVISLKLKQGLVPENVRQIDKVMINKNITGIVVNAMNEGSIVNVVYLYIRHLDVIYQINFINFSNEKIRCILSEIKSLEPS